MQISEAIYQALEGEQLILKIVADWIEDNYSGHPEAGTYCRRLRDPQNIRIQTVIDVIAKFGTRKERKEICRIQRIVLCCRKNTIPNDPNFPDKIIGLSRRREINHVLGNVIPPANRVGAPGQTPRYYSNHKRVVLSNFRARRVYLFDPKIKNNWPYLAILRRLIRITQQC